MGETAWAPGWSPNGCSRRTRSSGWWRLSIARLQLGQRFSQPFSVTAVLTIPKMLRIHFLHHRELLGPLCRVAYETVKQLMVAAGEEKDLF